MLTSRISVVGLQAAEPIAASILPIATPIGVGNFKRHNPFRHLDTELYGRVEAHRKTKWVVEDFVIVACRQNGLGMQGRRHVETTGVVVRALESNILGACIG